MPWMPKRLHVRSYCLGLLLMIAMLPRPAMGQALCSLTDVLSINTGYNHITSTLIPHNQRDTFWRVTGISAKSASYFPGIGALPYVSYSVVGMYWPTRSSTSEWISFLPNGTYTEVPPNHVDSLWTEFSRDFRLCEADTLSFDLSLTDDNFCEWIKVDGIAVPPAFPFNEPATVATSHHTSWTAIPKFTMALAAGVHRLTFRQHNYPVGRVIDNPVGLSVKGTISSVSLRKSIVGYASALDCKCNCALTVLAQPKDTTICAGDSMTLRASGANTYIWSPASFLSNAYSAAPIFKGTTSTQYIVQGTDSSGCKGYDTLMLTVNPKPTIVASPKAILLCVGDSVQLQAAGGTRYVWQPGIGLDDSTSSKPKLALAMGAYKIVLRGYNLAGCSNTDTVAVSMLPSPVVVALPPDTAGCVGNTVQLYVSGAPSYTWLPNAGIDDRDPKNPKLTITNSISYVVKGTDSNGCSGYDTINIKAYPKPELRASQERINDNCFGNEVQLRAVGANSYTWTPDFYCNNPKIANPIVTIPSTQTFTVYGSNDAGCMGSDTVTVLFAGKSIVRIPNAFTPNNDGLNDKFRPIIVCGFDMTEFLIYNRWGQQVFATSDKNKAWDGNIGNVEAELGVYFYLLKGNDANGESLVLKGDVTLVR